MLAQDEALDGIVGVARGIARGTSGADDDLHAGVGTTVTHGVDPVAADEGVRTSATDQLVVAGPTIEDVVAGPAEQAVGPVEAPHVIVVRGADQDVGGLRPLDPVEHGFERIAGGMRADVDGGVGDRDGAHGAPIVGQFGVAVLVGFEDSFGGLGGDRVHHRGAIVGLGAARGVVTSHDGIDDLNVADSGEHAATREGLVAGHGDVVQGRRSGGVDASTVGSVVERGRTRRRVSVDGDVGRIEEAAVPRRGEDAATRMSGDVAGHRRVDDLHDVPVEDTPAVRAGGLVVRDLGLQDRRRTRVEDATARTRRIVGDRGAFDRQFALVVDAAAHGGPVVRHLRVRKDDGAGVRDTAALRAGVAGDGAVREVEGAPVVADRDPAAPVGGFAARQVEAPHRDGTATDVEHTRVDAAFRRRRVDGDVRHPVAVHVADDGGVAVEVERPGVALEGDRRLAVRSQERGVEHDGVVHLAVAVRVPERDEVPVFVVDGLVDGAGRPAVPVTVVRPVVGHGQRFAQAHGVRVVVHDVAERVHYDGHGSPCWSVEPWWGAARPPVTRSVRAHRDGSGVEGTLTGGGRRPCHTGHVVGGFTRG